VFDWMRKQKPFLGVDIGSASIKVVQLVPSGRGVRLKHASLIELQPQNGTESETPVQSVSKLLRREKNLAKERLATLFSGPNVIIRYLTLPKMPLGELEEAVRWEAKKQTTQPLEDFVVDFFVMGETQHNEIKRNEIILVMAESTLVKTQMEEFQGSGFTISALDINQLVLLNTIRHHRPKDLSENLAFIDIGAGHLDIGIAKNGILRFTRSVQNGGEGITQAIQRELNVDFQEAERMKRERGLKKNKVEAMEEGEDRLYQIIKEGVDRFVVEVQRSVDYYRAQFRENAIQRLLLMGGCVQLPGFLEYFSTYFDAPVEVDDPFSRIQMDDRFPQDLRTMGPRFATSIGLALRKG